MAAREKLTVTKLRQNIYAIVDQVLETGVPVEVKRNDASVLIVPAQPAFRRLDQLPRRDAIVGDPDDLISVDVSEWHGEIEPT